MGGCVFDELDLWRLRKGGLRRNWRRIEGNMKKE